MPRTAATLLIATALLALLAACGRTVSITGTADEAWNETLATLRMQGAMPSGALTAAEGAERPRVDREEGEIDLIHAPSVYYGTGAAFIQVDVSRPADVRERTVRMWVDYPVGNKVVRYGRAIDEDESDRFHRAFVAAHAKVLAARPAPAPQPAQPDSPQGTP
ncbi:MAG: hypothetical protein ACKOYN_11750 [Planctomycetota bacterium]